MYTEFDIQILEYSLQFFREFIKNHHDYFKHLTTLITGSILVIIAITEGIFDNPECLIIIGLSFFFFLVSLISALYMLQVLNGYNEALFNSLFKTIDITEDAPKKILDELNGKTGSIAKSAKCFHPITDISFLIGVVLFLVFTLINLI